MPGYCHVLTGTENGWIGDLLAPRSKLVATRMGPGVPTSCNRFFLRCVCRFTACFFCWPRACCGPHQEIILALQAAPNVEEFATLGQWGVECLQLGWCLSLGITKNDDACNAFRPSMRSQSFLDASHTNMTTVSCCMPAPLEGPCLVVKWCCIVVD